MEAGDPAPREDGGQPWVLLHGEAAAQRILGESVHRDGSQMILFQLQQRHRAATEMRAQAGDQPLQADGGGRSTTRSASRRFCMG